MLVPMGGGSCTSMWKFLKQLCSEVVQQAAESWDKYATSAFTVKSISANNRLPHMDGTNPWKI